MNPSTFLALLWGKTPPGLIQLWTKHNKASNYLRNPAGADIIANNQTDIYTGVGLAARDHGKHRRCQADQIAAIAGLWVDLDVNGGPENKAGAAPNHDAARALAHIELAPTLVIHSGYGLHAWWLLEEPWVFQTTEDRDRAALASAQWYELHRQHSNWTIDGTHDLARLLRLPGTINGKGGQQAPVTVLEDNERRYSLDVLLERCGQVKITQPAAAAVTDLPLGLAVRQAEVDHLAARSRIFEKTWEHDRPDHPEWSTSEYDLALCSIAAHHEWTDAQLAGLIALHRRKHGDPNKAERADYVSKTIQRARQVADPDRRVEDIAYPKGATLSPAQWADHIVDMLNRTDEGAIPLPFAEFNDTLDGGIRPAEVCLVAGYTSHGKSIFVDQIADAAAAAGRNVHLYMTEMTAYQRGLRLLARRTEVPFRKLKRRSLDSGDWSKLFKELEALPYGCTIVADWTVDQMCTHIRENQWDLAVVDLVHGFHYTDERDLSKTSSALARAAKGSSVDHKGTAIVAAAHLNDGQIRDSRSPKRPKPGLHSIKGSSSLKQDADMVMFVWQEDDEDGKPTGTGAIWFAKSRGSELAGVEVDLNPIRMKFEIKGPDWAREEWAA